MVVCLDRGADLHMAQLMPLPLTVSCFSKIQNGFTFLVLARLGSPRQRAVKLVYVCVLTAGCLQLPEICWNTKLLLEVLEISWNLVDARGNFIISDVIFARQTNVSTLYIVKFSGKQDHYDLRRNDEHGQNTLSHAHLSLL